VAAFLVVSVSAWGADGRNLAVARKNDTTGQEPRLALVIGNSTYASSPLRNPVNDARALTKSLQALGFQVIHKENVSLKAMASAVRDFGKQLSDKRGVGLFYYAGHGMQVGGRNYLIPVDADIQGEDEVAYNALDANQVLGKMDSANNRLNVVILDACRNNPFARSFRSASSGLAEMKAPSGTLVAFATSPGSVASDGEGTNGVYTKHLVQHMSREGVSIEQVFKQVRIGVMRDTKDHQTPWESSSLVGDFYFKAARVAQVAATVAPAPEISASAIDLAFWESIKASKYLGDFQAYLDQHPNGKFAALARSRIKQFAEEGKQKPGEFEMTFWTSIQHSHSPADFQAYLSQFPGGRFVSLARNRLDQIAEGTKRPVASGTTVASVAPVSQSVSNSNASMFPRVGDTWTYTYKDLWGIKRGMLLKYEVVNVSDKEIRDRLSTDGKLVDEKVFRDTPSVVSRDFSDKGSRAEFSPYPQTIGHLGIGDELSNILFIRSLSHDGEPWVLKGKVVKRESIKVPAGKYETIKLEITGERRNHLAGRTGGNAVPVHVEHEVWYAPSVKRVIKQVTRSYNFHGGDYDKDSFELVSYKLNQ
jgi:uncharacterized caspase-like protein